MDHETAFALYYFTSVAILFASVFASAIANDAEHRLEKVATRSNMSFVSSGEEEARIRTLRLFAKVGFVIAFVISLLFWGLVWPQI